MKKIEEKFKKDFEESHKVELSFDVRQLESNDQTVKPKNRRARKIIIIAASSLAALLVTFIALPVIVFFASATKIDNSVKTYQRRYTFNEINIAETNSFKSLNEIIYPNSDKPTASLISENEKDSYANFVNTTYQELSSRKNLTYSSIGLYSILNNLEAACGELTTKEKLNNLLGLNQEERINFYHKIMLANSFANNENTTQLKNSAFFINSLDYNQDYIDYLSRVYSEAYQLDFAKDANKIVEWVNKAVNDNKFIDKQFLEIDEETCLFLFSTLYFKNAWNNKYLKANNLKDSFYLNQDQIVEVDYMRHSYYLNKYYDYDSYISFKDYYANGNASITYLIPKNQEDNIHDLIKDRNIFLEDEDKARVAADRPIMVNLQTPKFSIKGDINFKESLSNLGLESMFNRYINTFSNAFDDKYLGEYNFYLQTVKQRNEVSFNEDGTIIKSVTMAGVGKATSVGPQELETLDVKLNQPFIYIIKDINDTPIFVGHVDNPIE